MSDVSELIVPPLTYGSSGPAQGAAVLTPDDNNNYADGKVARSLYITGAGDVNAVGLDGVEFTVSLPDNFIFPVATVRLKTGTTATGVVALW